MKIFLTGATGFIGSAIVPELIGAGHQVVGVTRSESGAQTLVAAGAQAYWGNIDEPESLRAGAAESDAVMHTAFDHNFANFVANCEKDRRVIETLGDALAGSSRQLIITSGTGMGAIGAGAVAVEDVFDRNNPNPRRASELAGVEVAERGVNVAVVRLPQVHDTVKQGLITPYIAATREKGKAAYVGDGSNRWPSAHVSDVARLYRLAVEKQENGARYHAVAEEGVATRDIAEVIGKGLNLPVVSLTSPEEIGEHFGWLASFAGWDLPASSEQTRQSLGWQPTGPGLIADLEKGEY